MNRILSALCVVVALAISAAAQTAATSTITQLFGFPCDAATLTQCPDGSIPTGFIESADGNFYGIAVSGGTGLNSPGTVFKLTPRGEFTLLYSFAEQPDFSLPYGSAPSGLVEGLDGNLYGLALSNGLSGVGTALRLTKAGVITLLHNFCNTIDCSDGGSYYKFIASDQNGAFSLTGLTPGEYKAFAWEDIEPGAYMDPDFMKPIEEKGETVSLQEGEQKTLTLKVIPVLPLV